MRHYQLGWSRERRCRHKKNYKKLCSYEYKIIVCQLNQELGLFDKNPIYQDYVFVSVLISEQPGSWSRSSVTITDLQQEVQPALQLRSSRNKCHLENQSVNQTLAIHRAVLYYLCQERSLYDSLHLFFFQRGFDHKTIIM